MLFVQRGHLHRDSVFFKALLRTEGTSDQVLTRSTVLGPGPTFPLRMKTKAAGRRARFATPCRA